MGHWNNSCKYQDSGCMVHLLLGLQLYVKGKHILQRPCDELRNMAAASVKATGTAAILSPRFSYLYSMGQCWTKLFRPESDYNESPRADLSSGNVHLITAIPSWEEKLSEASRDGKIVVANFSASWCSPCRVIAPVYCELADKYPFMIFLTVDVDELAEFCSSWDIKATPTFFFLKDGRQMDKLVGANKLELQKKTASVADSATRSM
ncbi:hypothetical protein F0562_026407 [Nyssa sinensis]|uniref:Thioredoxin domain-containing protein n=1 Tax=Nyssa sinensis TaxID=561372 RepID=A0A5J5B8Y4_9ASTE|nr:hypothetical protein F0562_026407 [Nyssa sinensis]